ncbi:Ubiquitin-like protein [Plasmopara halstedii]|uniref:Ubiquitin-like protein n=1 Tax=Plasmopara halstedii TaxID=4781 RepID=A0A0N7L7S7_PLAHL|nr:Ubiquitin-like protein [Plasmopara halstedii]CEG47907.1 Ubiquitin-like protein [Plasmopara halstedii]|eukprot:XP_024584276.1 Ubiquitin-like protein [Plasmopara halstedii]
MGRFLGSAQSTASSERNRRYEMLAGVNEEDENVRRSTEVATTPHADDDARVVAPSVASRLAPLSSDSEIDAEGKQHINKEAMDQVENVAEDNEIGIKDESTTEDGDQEPVKNTDPEAVHVRILDLNGKFFNISCRLDWHISQMKLKVLECTEVAIASQRLIYRGRVLEDEATLASYKVEDGHTIHLFVRAAPTPDPEILNAEVNSSGTSAGGRDENMTVVNINSEIVSSAVFPSDSARRVDPLMLDSPLGNCARRVKLWSSFLLIIYTMKVMGQFALLANDQQQRAAQQEQETAGISGTDRPINRFDEYPQYFTPDPLIGGIELMIHSFGVYIGCVGFKAAHDTDIRPIRFYCRGVVWLAILTVVEQIYTTVQISRSDFSTERVQYPYGGPGPTKDDLVSANIFQTVMLMVMWIIAIRHSYSHQREVSIYNQSFAAAAMNAAPPVHLPEVV